MTNRADLIEKIVDALVDAFDDKDLVQIAIESLTKQYMEYSDDELADIAELCGLTLDDESDD
jgi:division protein CdvB (Snf7/Vps24/ESCRT-III family)